MNIIEELKYAKSCTNNTIRMEIDTFIKWMQTIRSDIKYVRKTDEYEYTITNIIEYPVVGRVRDVKILNTPVAVFDPSLVLKAIAQANKDATMLIFHDGMILTTSDRKEGVAVAAMTLNLDIIPYMDQEE